MPGWYSCFQTHINNAFPDLRAFIEADCKAARGPGEKRALYGYSANVYILHTISTSTLASVTSYPLKWNRGGLDQRKPVQVISSIELADGAALTMGNSATNRHFASLRIPDCLVTFRNAYQDAAPPGLIEASMESIREMLVSPEPEKLPYDLTQGISAYGTLIADSLRRMFDKISSQGIDEIVAQYGSEGSIKVLERLRAANHAEAHPKIEFDIENTDPANMETWVAEVSPTTAFRLCETESSQRVRKMRNLLIVKPESYILFRTPYQRDIQKLREMASDFQAMFQRLWQHDAGFRHQNTRSNAPFFTIRTRSSDDDIGILRADFNRRKGLNGFTISITHYTPGPRGRGTWTRLFTGQYTADNAVPPVIGAAGNIGAS